MNPIHVLDEVAFEFSKKWNGLRMSTKKLQFDSPGGGWWYKSISEYIYNGHSCIFKCSSSLTNFVYNLHYHKQKKDFSNIIGVLNKDFKSKTMSKSRKEQQHSMEK